MFRNWLARVTGRRILVHTTNDQTFEGVLVRRYSDGILLRGAKLLGHGIADGTPLAGDVWLPREELFFCQLDR